MKERNNWIITVPKSISWDEYKEYLKECRKNPKKTREYMPVAPNSKVEPGDRCYIVNNDLIRGYQVITHRVHLKGHTNPMNNKKHTEGEFMRLEPVFHRINNLPMKGFRGLRRYNK